VIENEQGAFSREGGNFFYVELHAVRKAHQRQNLYATEVTDCHEGTLFHEK
jgi:hypothetical protein